MVFIVLGIANCYCYSHNAIAGDSKLIVQDVRRENLAALVDQFDGQGALAHKVSTAPNYISQIVTGKRALGNKLARKIEKAIGLPLGAMDIPNLGGKEALALADDRPYPALSPVAAWELREEVDRESNAMIPMLSGELAAGDGSDITEYVKCTMPFSKHTLRRKGVPPESAYMVEVSGNSMQPRMFDGDFVVVNISDKNVREGQIYAIRDGELLRVKVLIPQAGGGMIIRSLNSTDFPDEVLDGEQVEDRIDVIGKVFHLESMAF